METKLSIITVTYKNWQVVEKMLDSIEKYNDIGQALEVIIVDNSLEKERIDQHINLERNFRLEYVKNQNKGFGQANNVGFQRSAGTYVGFLNPDIILIEPIFTKIIGYFEKDETIGMLGGKLLSEDLTWTFSFYYDYNLSFFSKWYIKYLNRTDKFQEDSMAIAGADMFFRRCAFEECGLFDENIFMFYEEPDITRRIKRLHKYNRIQYMPDVKMIHLEKASTPKTRKMTEVELESCVYYGKKYGLDYRKKVKADYAYLKNKLRVLRLTGKGSLEQLEENIDVFEKFLSKERE